MGVPLLSSFITSMILESVKREIKMSEAVWSVVKFHVKEGCEEEFLAALALRNETAKKLYEEIITIQIDPNNYLGMVKNTNVDAAVGVQMDGLDWLDSVEHLLVHNDEGSRTEWSLSGFEINF